MVKESIFIVTIIIQTFGGERLPVQIETVTDEITCQEQLKDFNPVKMNMMGATMEATAKCVPLTSKEKDNIIESDNEWETEL
tara:strand:+ start:230 stop:475 length:246 start_codon:yes stop_codon:yes gene_type:complete